MTIKTTFSRLAKGTALVVLAGCADFLTVRNPTVIEVDALDPVADAPLLANSAMQNMATAYGWLIMYSGWMSGEIDVAETFPTRNEYGRRDVSSSNGSHSGDVWTPLSLAAASSYLVLEKTLPDPTINPNYQKAHFALAWSFVFMAETFCEGTVKAGPSLSTAAMLDSAIAHFTSVSDIGVAAIASALTPAADTARIRTLVNAALVGRARAHLQRGNAAQAIADANAVPAGFVYNLEYFDDLSNRTRLGNRMWQFTADRGSIAIAPFWRVTDPRIPQRVAPSSLLPQDANYTVDRGVAYVIQDKYNTFARPIRLASKMEADYIAAEAGGTATQLALLDARRIANGQGASGLTVADPAGVLMEFENQRGREFFLEMKRMGDLQRNGVPAVQGVPVAGAAYFKSGFAPIGTQVCWPLPITETDNNPNFARQ
jgi:starch-binding outer membrane protein, SusD/RagB family